MNTNVFTVLDLIIILLFVFAGIIGAISVADNWHRHAKKMSEEREKNEYKRF